MAGHVMAVLGPLAPDALGLTLPHEHILMDMAPAFYGPPVDAADRQLAERPVELETLWWVHERPTEHRDNMTLDDEDVAARELGYFRDAGGATIVDCTTRGLFPKPEALARVSRASGVNIVLGTGYYVSRAHPSDMDSRSVEQIAEELVRDLTVGIDDTGVRAGLIGELGVGGITAFEGIASFDEVGPNERKVLRAAALAQRQTGVAISIHPPRSKLRGLARSQLAYGVLDLLEGEGAAPDRIIIGHLDGSRDEDAAFHKAIASRGAYVEYDVWGWNNLYWPSRRDGFLQDSRRIELVLAMLDAGHANRLLLAHDICTKHRLRTYGGHGYAYLPRFGAQMLRANGVTQGILDTLMVANPARVLAQPGSAEDETRIVASTKEKSS